ncbi:hypothetical protein LV89_01386 [Arcicella aurantiaca]|uniref:LTXXQ motif family protein n=1 Tax=Arcicella aurantiaca TaxID=591202 RepID=A0A316ED79_9BACT|nr:hypothetical protein [Arcicella aurantiaca]PWK27979.1 hypothetical protein LV89_01386 [Arcicella aurantiaca]
MKKLQYIFVTLCLFLLVAHENKAQYGGGYGGGYGRGYGGGGGFRSDPGGSSNSKKDDMDPEKMSTEETNWMKKKLKLTEEQIPKVETININYAFKKFDLFEDAKKLTPPYPEDVRLKFKDRLNAIREGKSKELKAVLTEEQYEIYLKKRQD